MSLSQIKFKLLDLLLVFGFFLTPLLFFIQSHDQFELPKLTFMALLTFFFLLFELQNPDSPNWTPLTGSLLGLLFCQSLASLPWTSLSWRTSLFGEYENFSGLTTLLTLLIWFAFLSRTLNEHRISKIFYFNSLAAILSSLYAIGQHFGFDFIQWNPDSINATREFAALGNPNFLSAYLAMSLPLFWSLVFRKNPSADSPGPRPGILYWFLGLLGALFLLLGTDKGLSLLHFPPSDNLRLIARTLGLLYFSAVVIRFDPFRALPGALAGSVVIALGLVCTGSRGGFLGAFFGSFLWIFLTLREGSSSLSLGRSLWGKLKTHPFLYPLLIGSFTGLLIFVGRGFFERLWLSLLHVQESLALSRLHIWGPGLRMVKAHPFLGVGLDNFKIIFPFYSGVEFNLIDGMFTSSRMAHNELLQMASTTGLLGLAAYLAVIAAFGSMWWKSYRSGTPAAKWVLTAILSSAVAYHVQNFFSFGVATIDLLWFFLLAAVQFHYRKLSEKKGTPFFADRLWKAAALVLALLILNFPLNRLAADIAYSHGSAASELLKSSRSGQTLSSLNYYSDFEIYHLRKAVDLFPWDVKYQLYLGLAYEQRAPLDKDHFQDLCLKALESYQKAIEMSPANAYYYNDEGRTDEELSRFEPSYLAQAEKAYERSVQWAPASPFFLINWGLSLKKLGKVDEGEDELQKAFTYSPDFTAKVLGQMGEGAYQNGDKKTAFELADQAVKGDTTSAEAYYYRGYMYLREKEKKKALADFERVKSLNPSAEKDPGIQLLDQFIDEAKK